MKCLITGCEGFIGSHLADLLVAERMRVFGMVYGDTKNIDHLKGSVMVLPTDLNDRERVESMVTQVSPDIVFHLAAQSFVTASWQDPEQTLRTNVLGTLYLLEALRKCDINPVTIIVGSSSAYGSHDAAEMPLREDDGFRPTSVYGVSKAGEDLLGYFYWRAYGRRILRVRPFNITGPRKTSDACSDFARGIAEVEIGLRASLEVGNLDAIRDITDGRDAAVALWVLARNGLPGEVYNLCSGRAYKMGDVLQMLISLSAVDMEYRVAPEKVRPYDDPIYLGDNRRLRALGWEPRIPLEETLADLLDYWRSALRAERRSRQV